MTINYTREVDGLTPDLDLYATSKNCPHPPDELLTRAYCMEHDLVWPRHPAPASFEPGVKRRIVNDATKLIDELCTQFIEGYVGTPTRVATGMFASDPDDVQPVASMETPKLPGAPLSWGK